MTGTETFASLAVALGTGFLVGLQREQSAAEKKEAVPSALGGIRTFPLVALAGALCSILAGSFGAWIIGLGFAALLVPFAIAYWDDVRHGRDRGITSEVSFTLTFLLGVLAAASGFPGSPQNRLLLAAAIGVAVTALLSLKRPLHEFVARVSPDDIYATVKFGVLALVVLPLLPDRVMGPFQVLNPFKVGLLVALIAGTSFTGYLAIRMLGPGRGLGVTGLLGGLVSSTAITLSFSGRARQEPVLRAVLAMGVVLASTVMAARVIAMIAVVNPVLLPQVCVPMGAMCAGGLLASAVLYRKGGDGSGSSNVVKLINPFELSSALKFGGLYVLILLVSKAATTWAGSAGVLITSVVAGATDVDAVTLTVAQLAGKEIAPAEAATAVLLAAGSNTVVKAGIAFALGGAAFGGRVVGAFALMLAAGGAGAAWLWRS